LDQHSRDVGLLLAQEHPHEECIDGIHKHARADQHGEPEHGTVENIFVVQLHRVLILLNIQQSTRDHGRSRGTRGGQAVGVSDLVILIAVGQRQHHVRPVEITRELNELGGEGDVDEGVVGDELEKVEHLPGLSRALITPVTLLKELLGQQGRIDQDGGSDVVHRHGREDANEDHEEEDDDHNNGRNQQTNLIFTTSIPGTASSTEGTVEVTRLAFLGISAPTASTELGNTLLLNGEGITRQEGSNGAIGTSPERGARASEIVLVALTVTEAVGGALTSGTVGGKGPIREALALTRETAATLTKGGTAIRSTLLSRAISTVASSVTDTSTELADTIRGIKTFTAIVGASSVHVDTRHNRVLQEGHQGTVASRRSGISNKEQASTTTIADITRVGQIGRKNQFHRAHVHAHHQTSLKHHKHLTTNLVDSQTSSDGNNVIRILDSNPAEFVTISACALAGIDRE